MSSIDVQHSCNEISTVVKWKIENFTTQASKETQIMLHSPIFYLYKSRLSFSIRLDTISSKDKRKDFTALYLIPKNLDNEKKVDMKWKFWMENEDAKKIGRNDELNYNFGAPSLGFGYTDFIKHTNLYPPESDFIKNDSVFVCCKLVQNESQGWFKQIPLNDSEILKSYYKKNQSGEKSGKLTIQMKNKTFKVKKALLALKSSVFDQMLQNESFSETKTSSIKIDDFEPEVMEAFNEFLHLEFISQENVKHVHELLKLSDKYNVIKLKEECTQILSKTLSKENIFQFLVTCFTHDCPKLKENVMDYLTLDNPEISFNTIVKTKEWKKFVNENEAVSDEIFDAVFARVQWVKKNGNGEVPSTSNVSNSPTS